MDQSSPVMSADAGKIVVCNAIFRLSILVPFGRYSRSKCEVVRNRAEKSMFFGPQFFWGDPEILDLIFKIAPISDHVAKFRGDRPRERGDLALKKKTPANIRARPGGPNKNDVTRMYMTLMD